VISHLACSVILTMRRDLRMILVLGASLLPGVAAVAETRTCLRMPCRQTGVSTRAAQPLGKLIEDAEDVTVLEVVDVDRRQGIITFKSTAALKGKAPGDPVRHHFGESLPAHDRGVFLEWAKPGKIALSFRESGWGTSVCVGNAWYLVENDRTVTEAAETFTATYVGSAERLREHVAAIIAGKEVVVTARRQDAAPLPMRREWLRGQKGHVWRLRASATITFRPDEVPVDESEEFVGWGGDKGAVPRLTEALKDTNAFLRCEAAEDLGQVGPPARDALAALRLALDDPDAHVRVYAALALGRIDKDDKLALPALLAGLKEKAGPVRRAAVAALAELAPRDGAAVPELLRALTDDPDKVVRAGAAFALGRVAAWGNQAGDPPAGVLAALLNAVEDDKDELPRLWSIWSLRRFGLVAKPAIPALKAGAQREPEERELALDTLARLGPVGVPALCEVLKQAKLKSRLEIMKYLEEMGPAAKEAVPILRESLKADSYQERSAAVAALMRIAWKSDARAITEALRLLVERGVLSGAAYLRVGAYLRELGPGDEVALPAVIAWQKKVDGAEGAAILGRLGRVGIPALRALVDDRSGADPEVAYALWCLGYKREAVTALRQRWETTNHPAADHKLLLVLADVGPDAAEMVPLLNRALRKEPEDWRQRYDRTCVALALWRVQKPVEAGGLVADPRREALDVLLALLRDNHIEAMEALGQIGPEARAAVPGLVKATKHQWWDTRSYAARALGRVGAGSPDAVEALDAALKDRNSQVRLEAAIALTRLGRTPAGVAVMADLLERRPSLIEQLAETLGELGADARPAVPVLMKLLRHDDRHIHLAAARILRKIDPKAAGRAGIP